MGYNFFGETNVPATLSNVTAIAAGGFHSLALKNDGTVVAWGAGTNYTGSSPAYGQSVVPANATNVVAIAAGDFHSLTLRADGTVVGWGYTNYGQARVPDGLSNVVAIAAGDTHSLALKADGTFVGWGNNSYGQTTLPAGLTGAVAIAGGNQYSLVTTPGPGFLAKPPAAVALAPGASTNLSISVWSAGPFTNQWAFDGAPILGESGVDLMITNFDLTKAGAYSIAISNQQGYAIAVSVLRLTNSPVVLVDGVDFGGGTVTGVDVSQISMSSTFGKAGHIYYSLDGSEPDFTAIPYLTPISLSNSATLRGQ